MNMLKEERKYTELGKVNWTRDYKTALKKSKASGKPVLLFFQEVPGCSTCVNFGKDVLSHPLMVDAIENEFIPLIIFNNKPGDDAGVLELYNEPSWNNPVAHFIDADGNDIIPKHSNNYQPLSMLYKMMEVLEKTKGSVPVYMKLLCKDLQGEYGYSKLSVFETPCFWSGETTFGQLDAVNSTQPGFIDGREVVLVHYDPVMISASSLTDFAKEQGLFTIQKSSPFIPDKDPQYYLKQTAYRYLPLSAAQKTKINAAIPCKTNPEQYLSPMQKIWLKQPNLKAIANPDTYTLDIETAWEQLSSRMNIRCV